MSSVQVLLDINVFYAFNFLCFATIQHIFTFNITITECCFLGFFPVSQMPVLIWINNRTICTPEEVSILVDNFTGLKKVLSKYQIKE